MAVTQAGGVVAVIMFWTKLTGSLASCDFASFGRIGLSFETAEANERSPTSVET